LKSFYRYILHTAFLGIFIFLVYFSASLSGIHERYQHEVTVTLKLVQVYVLDKHGNTVGDLSKSDFELNDNGQTKPITDFEKHELSYDRLPQPEETSVPSPSLRNTHRKFFLFFDFAFNRRSGISKSKTAALDFLDTQVRPEDEVGVLSFMARKGLTLHEYLTSDHGRIRRVVEGLGPEKFLGRAWGLESEWIKDHLKVDEALGNKTTEKIIIAEQRALKAEAIGFTFQISEMAKALRGIPGIKNIILFSSGIPNYALYGGTTILAEEKHPWGDAQLRDRYSVMCQELAGSNCAVYAINVSGSGAAASSDEKDLKGDGALRQLARESGGKYFDNIYTYKDINRTIQKVTGTYYVLGYYIDERQDGRFHNVRVEVKRKGCSVLGQKGYFDPKPFSEYSASEKLLHIIDLALAENPLLQVPADVPLMALPILDGGSPAIVAVLTVPRNVASCVLANRAEALLLLFDHKGETQSIIPLKVDDYSSNEGLCQIQFALRARPGRAACRIALCNMENGAGARGYQVLEIPNPGLADLWIDPPLFLAPRRTEVTYAPGGTTLDGLYGYDPKAWFPLVGDLPSGTKTLLAALRIASSQLDPEIEISAVVNEMAGVGSWPVSVAVRTETGSGPTRKMLVEMTSEQFKPGSYILTVIAKERGRQAEARTAATITIK